MPHPTLSAGGDIAAELAAIEEHRIAPAEAKRLDLRGLKAGHLRHDKGLRLKVIAGGGALLGTGGGKLGGLQLGGVVLRNRDAVRRGGAG